MRLNKNYSLTMDVIARFFSGLIKTAIFSIIAGVLGFLITVSFINGNFPPTWNDVKLVKNKIETIAKLNKNIFFNTNVNKKLNKENGFKDHISDPTNAEINEVNQYHKNLAQMSQNLLEGELTFASKPSPEGEKNRTQENTELNERVQKLEELVTRLQNQIQVLNLEIRSTRSKVSK